MKFFIISIIVLIIIYWVYKRFFGTKQNTLFNAFNIVKMGHDEYAKEFLTKNEQELVTINPVSFALLKATVLLRLDEKEEALFIIDMVSVSYGNKPKDWLYYKAMFIKAYILLFRGEENKEDLVKIFDEIIAFEPTYGRAYLYKGIAYEYLGNKEKALENILKGEEFIKAFTPNLPASLHLLSIFDDMTMPDMLTPSLHGKFAELTTIQVHKERNQEEEY